MKLIELAKMTIRHGRLLNKKSELSLYFSIKKILIDKISESAFEDASSFLNFCILPSESKETLIIQILLEEPFYNKHLGKLVSDAERKELNRWLNNIIQATSSSM